jgi:hypothetical protein
MSPLADRRARIRYEVIGVLRGTLELSEPARVLNISGGGALLETTTPIPVGSTQAVHMTIDGHPARITSRVRHLSRIGQPPKESYAIGVEFVSPPAELAVSMANLLGEARADS